MSTHRTKLEKLEDSKLMDVVKNYRQYGYSDDVRQDAIEILESRGISQEELRMTGSFSNSKYDRLEGIYRQYSRNALIAFIFYLLVIVSMFTMSTLIESGLPEWTGIGLPLLLIMLFLGFLIASLYNQSEFSKIQGDDDGSDGAMIYLFLGMPFYAFMYFYFRNQMKERMRDV